MNDSRDIIPGCRDIILGCIICMVLAGCGHQRPHYRLHLSPWVHPATRPTSRPSSRAVANLSEVRSESWPATAFFSISTTSSVPETDAAILRLRDELANAIDEQDVPVTGPLEIIFRGRSTDLAHRFTIEAGYPVAPGTRASGKFTVKTLPALPCMAVTFTGSGMLIDKAYDKLEPAIDAAGLRRTGEVREVYQRWNGPDAGDTLIEIGIGVVR